MILSLKSLLRRNLASFSLNNHEDFQRKNKVIGVSYSKQWIHMFVLRGYLSDECDKNGEEPKLSMKLYYKNYMVRSESDLLTMWVDILNFSNTFLSLKVNECTPRKGFSQSLELDYWNLQPFIDAKSDEDDILFKIHNQLKKLCLLPNMAINKKIISEAKNDIGYSCKIQNTTFVKRIEKEEKYIIYKLLESRDTSRCLPQVINLYNSFIEYEELLPLPTRLIESELLELCMDICHALDILHSLNIIHRDVKIQNIMLRKPDNNPALQRYVLIDFSMSFHFEKTENGNIDTYSMSLANENYGTNSYKAPEVFSGQCYDESIDVFSLGATILCCLDKKRFVCSKKDELQRTVDCLDWQDKRFKQVIRMMVSKDPAERPDPKQIRDILNQTDEEPVHTVSTEIKIEPIVIQNDFDKSTQEEEIISTSLSQQPLVVQEMVSREVERFTFYTPSKVDSESDGEYDSDDSLSPIFSARTPILERSDFEFD